MTTIKTSYAETRTVAPSGAGESSLSAVSWGAILAGGVAAIAVSFALILLGSGLGFASVSPWSNEGVSLTTFSILTVIWFIITQWLASGFGGYITGRLRTKWSDSTGDEIFFRDTAHGFLAWAVATVFTVTCLLSSAAMVADRGVMAVSAVSAGAAAGHAQSSKAPASNGVADLTAYYVDTLYRTDAPSSNAPVQDANAETTRILISGVKDGEVSSDDKAYLSKLVSARTGLTASESEARVDNMLAQIEDAKVKAKKAADEARKAASLMAILTFLALLVGAFISSVAGALGGRHRYEY